MDSLFILREKIQELYAKNSRIIDKLVQFILGLVTFYLINSHVGFMKVAATPVVMVALSVICTFFPMTIIIIAASVLILAHTYAVSLAALGVTALIFLVMYIFYFRLAPKMALVVILTPIAFAFKIPYVIPVAFALISAPTTLVAVVCGTIVYFMLQYIEKAAAGMKGADAAGLMGQITAYVKGVFQNKEMWVVVAAFIISFLVVYTIRRQSVDHAWKIAAVAGAVANVVVVAGGNIALGGKISFATLIVGNIAAVIVGLILELFFFCVDYARSENLQYEDDEYYYYVKAVPKLSVATPEKTVKHINERHETEIIDAAEVRKRSKKQAKKSEDRGRHPSPKGEPVPKRSTEAKKHDMKEVDKMLLTRSLKKDLDME